MTLLWIVLLPLVGMVLPLLAERWGRVATTLAAAIPTLMALGMLTSLGPRVLAGEVLSHSVAWMPGLGLNLSLHADGLSFLFALLVLGIGALVVLYGGFYLSEKDPKGRFFAFLLLFMGSMLGVVLAGNLLLLALFWEMTSLSSFLLIGYWSDSAQARQGARLALTVTGMGGLALLGGVLILGHIVGSYELSDVLVAGPQIVGHALYLPMLALVLLGAFTKSAQFPFHFWLPNAMTAPTPVSAYLHSATMVKAGVFLLARLHPALSGSDAWFYIVTSAGLATLGVGAYVALYKHDLKGLLAYSTISHLGLITVLFGLGTKMAAVVGVFHIMNHAAFKASLFMTAGIIDHETGTRDLRILGGLRKAMPITAVLAALGAASMAGLPPFNGFLSKEMFFAEVLTIERLAHIPWAVPVVATLAGLFSVAYSVRMVHDVFFGKGGELPQAHPHDPPWGMWLPVAILVTVCVAVGLAPESVVGPLLAVAAGAVVGGDVPEYHLLLWHGLNLPLAMSGVAVVAGVGIYTQRAALYRLAEAWWPDISGKRMVERIIEVKVRLAHLITQTLDNGSLPRYIAITLGVAVLATALPFFKRGLAPAEVALQPVNAVVLVLWGILVTASVATVLLHRRRLVALIVLGVVGLLCSMVFVLFAAPDLALTQLSIEVVTILLMLLALYVLPKSTPREPGRARHVRDVGLSLVAGGGVAALAYAMLTQPFERPVSQFYLENAAYPVGGGTNVVNVTLVDFRGFDTMFEITVLSMAALGIYALMSMLSFQRVATNVARAEDVRPVMLTSVTRPLLPFVVLISVYIFLRGHNVPGGGFVAGIVTTVGLIVQYLASGSDWAASRMRLDFARLALVGVLVAVGAGLVSFVNGLPFLTQAQHFDLPLVGSFSFGFAPVFDFGVYLVVIGALMTILTKLGELSAEPDNDEDEARAHAAQRSPWKP